MIKRFFFAAFLGGSFGYIMAASFESTVLAVVFMLLGSVALGLVSNTIYDFLFGSKTT